MSRSGSRRWAALGCAPLLAAALAGCSSNPSPPGKAGTGGTAVGTGGAGTGGAGAGAGGSSSDVGSGGAGAPDATAGLDTAAGSGGEAGASATDGPTSDTLNGDTASVDSGFGTGPVAPVQRNGRWAFDMGELSFEVDPAFGGRITTFRLGSENLLTGPNVNPNSWGSTFWTSPQAVWDWPPPPAIDNQPYTVTSTATTLTLTGRTAPTLGVSVVKTFSADRATGSIRLEYKVTNQGQAQTQLAPWEVTRVVARGLTFFPTGSRMSLSTGATFPTTNADGITWFAYDPATIRADSKLFADGAEGWLAHTAQGLVFIKRFADVPAAMQAPGEGDVELYTNLLHTYLELEPQGPYSTLAPQESLTWTTTWYLRRLPATISATAGNAALVQFVRDTIR